MNPKAPLSPREITALLSQPTGQGYPPELLARRRAAYLQQAASLPIAPGVLSGKAFKNLHKDLPKNLHAGLTSTPGIVMQWVIGVIVAGLVVTAGIIYRHEIVEFFTPDAGDVVATEELSPLLPAATPTASSRSFKSSTPTEPSPTPSSPTPTPTRTRRLYLTRTPTSTPSRTPVPVQPQPTATNSGKHLGQTPTPPSQRKTPKP